MNPIRRLSAFLVLAIVVATQPVPITRAVEHVLLRGQDEEVLAVTDFQVKDGELSGLLANRSARFLRAVQLLIRNTWHWKNKFRPQEDTLSRAVYYGDRAAFPGRQSDGPFSASGDFGHSSTT